MVSGDTTLRGSVRVPSTSNKAMIRVFLPDIANAQEASTGANR
eukprot:CAMPEP_0115744968 /NCGR_PEP_ID=MMETSP0272-20121206/91881_1 /TAXON_ID=71861 /ORGANISM="Scrippsiella trochoidea, Strain CCMP3099" /LENGTH=42 /DNA_ID= /DNA_START= /DNA_END= /DNA_ORIENTATION=